jgi:hypothetical protein
MGAGVALLDWAEIHGTVSAVQASRRSGAMRISEFLSLFDVPVAEVMPTPLQA